MELTPGIYTFASLLDRAQLSTDLAEGDLRRFRVGGLGFDDAEKQFIVPDTADEVLITLDGDTKARFTVKKS